MIRSVRLSALARLLALAMFLGAAVQVHAAYDKRFDQAESYLRYFGEGKLKEAYDMLATEETFDDFVKRVTLVNKHFEHEMQEKGFDVVGKQVVAVSPMTFDVHYIIVSVRTQITVRKGTQELSDFAHSDVYFRFNAEGQIEMVHGIGEGWLC